MSEMKRDPGTSSAVSGVQHTDFDVSWIWRSREPAKCKPNDDYPYGKAMDLSAPGKPSCEVEFAYPAPGVGTWIATCKTCGYTLAVTAAGRADDPTKVKWACERKEPT